LTKPPLARILTGITAVSLGCATALYLDKPSEMKRFIGHAISYTPELVQLKAQHTMLKHQIPVDYGRLKILQPSHATEIYNLGDHSKVKPALLRLLNSDLIPLWVVHGVSTDSVCVVLLLSRKVGMWNEFMEKLEREVPKVTEELVKTSETTDSQIRQNFLKQAKFFTQDEVKLLKSIGLLPKGFEPLNIPRTAEKWLLGLALFTFLIL
jgi:hypothetical protein